MAGVNKRIAGPAYVASSATNIYTPAGSGQVQLITHIHVDNTTGTADWFSLWIGATGASVAGTEIFKQQNVDAHDVYDAYFSPGIAMASSDFLVGQANTASTLTITVLGKQYPTG